MLFIHAQGRAEAGPLLGSAAAGASAPPDAAALPDGPGAAPAAGRAAAHPQDRAEVRLFWRSGRKTARGAEQQSKALAQLDFRLVGAVGIPGVQAALDRAFEPCHLFAQTRLH